MGNLLVYKSSAGSGKTHTLVKEYLKIAFKSPERFRNILAITFTNKATEEMKSRIIEYLEKLSEGDESSKFLDLKNQLCDDDTHPEEIQTKAKNVIEKILHGFSDFSISTIDSFFNKIVRAFAKELKIPAGFEIQLDTDEVLEDITERLWKQTEDDPELMKYIIDYIKDRVEKNSGWNIDYNISNISGEIFKERYWEKKHESGNTSTESREDFIKLIGELNEITRIFKADMKGIALKAKETADRYNLVLDDFNYGKNGAAGYLLNKILVNEEYDFGSRVTDVINDQSKLIKKTSAKKSELEKCINDGFLQALIDAKNYYDSNKEKFYTANEILKTIYILGIFTDLISNLKDYRKENNILLQSDINNILLNLMSEDNSPFIFEKTGNRYNNFLIDEFQDTSSFQWKNLRPLIVNSLSEGNKSIIVGDVKQSIYRWRSGNMKLLLGKVKDDLTDFKNEIDTINLGNNYRSKKEIVEFNNNFFKNAHLHIDIGKDEQKELLEKAYLKDLEQNYLEYNKGGYVRIEFIEENKDDEEKAKAKALKKIPGIIEEVISKGYSHSDIMILIRTRLESIEVSNYLVEKGYSVVSSESLLVTSSPKVNLIVSLFRYVTDSKDVLAEAEAVTNYSVYIKQNKKELNKLFAPAGIEGTFFNELPQGLFADNKSNRSGKKLIEPELLGLNVYELAERLIEITGMDKSADAYLIKFLNSILEFSSGRQSDVVSFLEWWDNNKDKLSISVSESGNSVAVMTIHKAKGLQSKIVIVPFVVWGLNIEPNKGYIWASSAEATFNKFPAYLVNPAKGLNDTFFKNDYIEESELTRIDNLNLLYVAFTRPEDMLFAMVPMSSDNKISKLLEETISGSDEFKDKIKDGIYETGKVEKIAGKEISVIKDNRAFEHISSKWKSKIVVKPKNYSVKPWDKAFAGITTGNIVHNILSGMKTIDDLENTIEQGTKNGDFIKENIENIIKSIREIFGNEIIAGWFSPGWEVMNEKDILLPEGNFIRPDRIIINGKDVKVIDYKTGAEKPEHITQINKYAEALSAMNYNVTGKYLLYLDMDSGSKHIIKEVK